MVRNLPAAGVVAADTAVLVAGHRAGLPPWSVLACAAIVAAIIVLGRRAPVAALAAALILAALAGGGYVLLLWTAYHAGRALVSWPRVAVALGAALAGLGAQAALAPGARALAGLVASYLVFAALPLLTGRYLTQQERLVSMLGQRGEQERRRLAGDMHDSLGHRLSLVSVQAAALEVAPLPPPQRAAAQRLAATARGALDELHELVGGLRAAPGRAGTGPREPGAEAVDGLVGEFRAAGMRAELRRHGPGQPLLPASGQAAYRVVREGLTNAARHAPGQPVIVSLDWEPGALLLTISNEMPSGVRPGEAGPEPDPGSGLGLAGLSERVRSAGGLLDHGVSAGRFRLLAMLPVTEPEPARAGPDARRAVLGRAVAVLMFVILPATLLLGVR